MKHMGNAIHELIVIIIKIVKIHQKKTGRKIHTDINNLHKKIQIYEK